MSGSSGCATRGVLMERRDNQGCVNRITAFFPGRERGIAVPIQLYDEHAPQIQKQNIDVIVLHIGELPPMGTAWHLPVFWLRRCLLCLQSTDRFGHRFSRDNRDPLGKKYKICQRYFEACAIVM